MPLEVIVFGAIGTLVETSELQRQAFNTAFERAGMDWHWDKLSYQAMLQVTGGQKRIRQYAQQTNAPLTGEQIVALHTAKSTIYQEHIREHGLALRPGVAELVQQATSNGIKLAFASTTSQENIDAIDNALGQQSPFQHFAITTNRSTVQNGKPAPDVYDYVLQQLGAPANAALAIEDTADSLQSAVSAGVACVATPGDYVQAQDFSAAVAVAQPGQIADLDWLHSLIAEPSATP